MISVIIPTLNEERGVGSSIACVQAEKADCEIIVADGGSSDGTVREAESFRGVSVVRTDRGRGLQLNAGAAAAHGDILLFLHADTILEEGWSREMVSACERDGVAGGAFTLKIDCAGRRYRLTECLVKLRCVLFRLPYGDQGIFVKKDTFRMLGGFREIPLMEDVDIVERMKSLGRIVILERKALSNARKWMTGGWFRNSFRNQIIMLMYRLGADPHFLAKIYYRG